MRYLRIWFQNMRVRNKISLCFLGVLLLSSVVTVVIYDFAFQNSMTGFANDSSQIIIEQAKTAVETHINSMERIIAILSEDKNVLQFCDPDNRDVETADMSYTRIQILQTLNTVQSTYPEITGIALISEEDNFISNRLYKAKNKTFRDESWYRKCIESPNEVFVFTKPTSRIITYNEAVSSDEIMCVAKALADERGQVIGVILIDSKIQPVDALLKNVVVAKDGFVLILDAEDNVIYSPVNSITHRVRPEWFSESKGILSQKILGDDYQFIYETAERYGWKIIGVFSLDQTLKQVSDTRNILLITCVFTFAIAITISVFLASTVTKPLEKLSQLMGLVQKGNFNVRFNVRYYDEVGELGTSFNSMVDRIRQLISQVYMEQEEKRRAELTALQAQIKPHFLYNTLDTIHWMAKKYGAEDIIYVIRCLTNLFRVGLSKGNEIIPLSEEVEHVISYLKIQKVRYDDILSYTIRVDDETQGLYVHKLLLQPLVENAIYHGIKTKRDGGNILISIRRESEELIMQVIDNGMGMDQETVENLNAAIQGEKGVKSGYGLYNVNARIAISHGKEYGIFIESEKGVGTTATIRYPLIYSSDQIEKRKVEVPKP